MDIRHFDPQGVNLAKAPLYTYQSQNDSGDAILTIKVTRVNDAAGTSSLPYQLFGALNGIHSSENNAKFPGYKPAADYKVSINMDNYCLGRVRSLANILKDNIADINNPAVMSPLYAGWLSVPDAVALADSGADYVTQWLDNGSLKIGKPSISDENATYDAPAVIISCEEVPYKTLIENLKTSVLLVKSVRMGFGLETSLDRSLGFVYASMFGSDQTNNLVPRRYFTPEQQQSRIVDIDQPFFLTGELAINSSLAANEQEVSFVIDVTKFQKNAVVSSF